MDKRKKEFIEKYDMKPIVDVMDKALDKLNHITKGVNNMERMIVLKNCSCQSDENEMFHHYREGLKIKKLKKGEVVNFIREGHNCYGTFITVEKNGKEYDIEPNKLKPYKDN